MPAPRDLTSTRRTQASRTNTRASAPPTDVGLGFGGLAPSHIPTTPALDVRDDGRSTRSVHTFPYSLPDESAARADPSTMTPSVGATATTTTTNNNNGPNSSPSASPSLGYTSSASPVLNAWSSLRARLVSNPSRAGSGVGGSVVGSIVPTPPAFYGDASGSGSGSGSGSRNTGQGEVEQDDGGTGKVKPGRTEVVRETYPTRLGVGGASSSSLPSSSSTTTGTMGKKPSLRSRSRSRSRSRTRSEAGKGKRSSEASREDGVGGSRGTGFDSRGYPRRDVAVAGTTTTTTYPPTSMSGMGAASSASLLPSEYGTYDINFGSSSQGDPEAGPSRPPSVWSIDDRTRERHSPAPSYTSDAPFGARDSWGNPQLMGVGGDSRESLDFKDERTTGKARFLGLGQAAGGGGGSAISLGTLDARLTMGREINARGLEGLGGRYSLPIDPAVWDQLGPEPDDDFHQPSRSDFTRYRPGMKQTLVHMFSMRSISNLGCMLIMVLALTSLFGIWPVLQSQLDERRKDTGASAGGYNTGGINGTGQVPALPGHFTLIDVATPASAYKHISFETGEEWDLVFSDEFNVDDRTFWPGDDPFWEAGNQHYWSTNNLEWYDPRMVTTKGGHLVVTLDKIPNRGLNYSGALISSWNKFCYTGGYFEASLSLPGTSDVYGLWPAVWTLGNLGRAGYGGTLDGMWPYSYDECDVGTLRNQSKDGLPEIAFTSGDEAYNYTLSYLPGQRLSACTCPDDETHPGPRKADGTFVGRSAPEIDMIEAQVDQWTRIGHVSQSAQWAPFNPYYSWINNSQTYSIVDEDVTHLNTYQGGHYQQATSGIALTDQDCYTGNTGCLSIYGFEYGPEDDGYITWVNDGKESWTIRSGALAPNAEAEIGSRPIPKEPMYLIINLGISENFGAVDYDGLEALWPVTMLVDYVRIYQDPARHNIGCDPEDYPTAAYIERYKEAYNNPNITTWEQASGGAPLPKNRLIDTC